MKLRPITERPENIIPIYTCPVCGTMYKTFDEAVYCKNSYPISSQFPADLKPGSVVIIQNHGFGYAWHENEDWVARTHDAEPDHPSHFYHKKRYSFYYVVTHIGLSSHANHRYAFCANHRWGHRATVSLVTKAISDNPWHSYIYSGDKLEISLDQAKNEKLLAEVAPFIGVQATALM